MAQIDIYTKFLCPYCARAKALLERKGATFTEIDVTADSAAFGAMVDRSNGRRTVPQIFVDSRHIGGCDDLLALEAAGRLDPLLAAPPP